MEPSGAEAPSNMTCMRCKNLERRRELQRERYRTDESYREKSLSLVRQHYWKSPELIRAKAYMRLVVQGKIQKTNQTLIDRHTAALSAASCLRATPECAQHAAV